MKAVVEKRDNKPIGIFAVYEDPSWAAKVAASLNRISSYGISYEVVEVVYPPDPFLLGGRPWHVEKKKIWMREEE